MIPLAYHVDYWDRLGWRDPYSSRAWTLRQAEYVRALRIASAYTPQIVVNGSRQLVGSNADVLFAAIDEEVKKKAEGSVSVRIDGHDALVRASAPKADVDLIVVAYENATMTKVTAGENSGRSITNAAIARKLVRLGVTNGEQRVPLALTPNMGVVAFLQDGASRRILAATGTALSR